MEGVKVATCCYCGTRAALVLRGKTRHELACAQCGAPLSRMKMLPQAQPAQPARPAVIPAASRAVSSHARWASQAPKGKKPKKRKSFGRKVLSEIWDVVEDIFD